MTKSRSLMAKWNVFWISLEAAEKLLVLRMLGYRGAYPRLGVSSTLVARLLRLTLKSCHKSDERKYCRCGGNGAPLKHNKGNRR